MPRKKKTVTTSVAETVNETVKAPVKENVAEVDAPVDEKPAKKPVAKRTPAKKSAAGKAKTTTSSTEKTAKTATTAAAPKEIIKLQLGIDEYDISEIKKAVEADYKGKFNGKIKTVDIYVKPEDKAAYYVINSDFSDKIDL